ncbi:DDE superfamily endonuclease [Mesorhizobium tianshanense]|uniref:DDE superfamily endonuclease n=1 Tax=Mesorhizobium tianshanense TaxID=39844 RepID=A0A562N4T8_9HYPH|nr:DDE superfamily endonuclease [Mesorhizobium tianshanense]
MFKGRQFDQSVILLCVRWYLAYNVSLRDLEEMIAERGIAVDHTTIHRWTVRFSPLLLQRFNRRKRGVTAKWHVDETCIKVRGRWMYLYSAIDSVGDTVEFWVQRASRSAGSQALLQKGARAPWPARSRSHRRQPDQPGGNHLLRHDEPPARPLPANIETDQHSPEPVSQQSHRTGPPPDKAPCRADARLQVTGVSLHHSVRYRNGPHDAPTTGEVSSKSSPPDCSPPNLSLRPNSAVATDPPLECPIIWLAIAPVAKLDLAPRAVPVLLEPVTRSNYLFCRIYADAK